MKMNSKGILFASLAVIGLAVGISSCKKDLLNVNIPMEMAEITFTIPVSDQVGAVVQEKDVQTNIDKYLSDNKVKKENIKSIKIESLICTILEADTVEGGKNNFQSLQSLKGEMAVGSGSYFTVADVPNNPDSACYVLDMKPNTSTEYKDYLSSTSFKFRITGVTRYPVTSPIVMHVKLKFNLEGGL